MDGRRGIPVCAVFASGEGTNAENIIRAAQERPDALHVSVVVCDTPGAPVIGRARRLGVDCAVVPFLREGFVTLAAAKEAHEEKIVSILGGAVEWALLAGYMRIVGPRLLARFPGRMVNIHPSLLPAFPGRDGYGDAWRAGVRESGVTLHYVDAGIDTGPVIAQRRFPRLPGDSFADFRARGMALEHEVYREFLHGLGGIWLNPRCA